MGKPSIFSSEYRGKMKKRRQRTRFLCFLLFLVLVSLGLYINTVKKISVEGIKNYISSIFNGQNVNNLKHEGNVQVTPTPITKTDTSPSVKPSAIPNTNGKNIDEAKYSVKLSDGNNLDVIYREVDGVNKFTNVIGIEETLNYNISPLGNGIVIYDGSAQNIIYVNIDGTITDITKKSYTDSSGNVFLKADTLKTVPGYLWASDAKFIDNNNVAYLSNLPWFGRGTKYLWIVNVNSPENHLLYEGIAGTNVTLDKLEEKGLGITIDGVAKHINANGILISN